MMNHWMFRCKDVSQLISRSMDEDLGFWTRMGIWFHLKMCHLCRRYRDQLHVISQAVSKMGPDPDAKAPAVSLPKDAAEKISAHLENLISS